MVIMRVLERRRFLIRFMRGLILILKLVLCSMHFASNFRIFYVNYDFLVKKMWFLNLECACFECAY